MFQLIVRFFSTERIKAKPILPSTTPKSNQEPPRSTTNRAGPDHYATQSRSTLFVSNQKGVPRSAFRKKTLQCSDPSCPPPRQTHPAQTHTIPTGTDLRQYPTATLRNKIDGISTTQLRRHFARETCTTNLDVQRNHGKWTCQKSGKGKNMKYGKETKARTRKNTNSCRETEARNKAENKMQLL